MKNIKAVSVWWYTHHPADTEVNFHRHGGKLGSYDGVTPSSRERLGTILRNCQPIVSISANYTYIYYAMKAKS